MNTRQQRIQTLYEISLSIGPKETLEATADHALSGYLKKLNCSVGAVFERTAYTETVSYDAIATIPAAPATNETLQSAFEQIPTTAATDKPLRDRLPITGQTAGGSEYYLLNLPEFGLLVLGKRGGSVDDITLSALKPLNEKLAEACHSKQVESQLRKERNRFEAVFDAIPEPVANTVVEDGDERVKRINEPFAETFETPEESARGTKITEFISPDDDPKRTEQASDMIDKTQSVTSETSRQTTDGTREFLFRGVPVNTAHSEEYIRLYTDITAQKQRQQELERYQRLVEHLPIGVYRTTPGEEGEFRLVNQGLVDIFGGDSKRDFQELSVTDIYVDPDERKQFSNLLIEQGTVDGYELQLETIDGNSIWCEISGIAVEEDGETVFELALQDITKRKEHQQQLAVLNRVLRHNLRNAMNVIEGNASLLGEAIDDTELQAYITAIEQRASNLEQLSEKAATVRSLFEQGRASNATYGLNELFTTVAAEFRETHPNATLTIGTFDPVTIRADIRLEVAVLELISNAVVHNDKPNPEVTVTAEPSETLRSGSWIDISITDNGPGIPADERRAIETGEETPLQHGTGLGLWLVYWTVLLLGGDIAIENNLAGTRVVLTLPRASTDKQGECHGT